MEVRRGLTGDATVQLQCGHSVSEVQVNTNNHWPTKCTKNFLVVIFRFFILCAMHSASLILVTYIMESLNLLLSIVIIIIIHCHLHPLLSSSSIVIIIIHFHFHHPLSSSSYIVIIIFHCHHHHHHPVSSSSSIVNLSSLSLSSESSSSVVIIIVQIWLLAWLKSFNQSPITEKPQNYALGFWMVLKESGEDDCDPLLF